MGTRLVVPIGTTYNYLTVLKELPTKVTIDPSGKKRYRRYFKCKCVCNNVNKVELSNLRTGSVASCGCQTEVITHGLTKHPLYFVYVNMLKRCYDKEHKSYKDYGARGIKVCKEWRDTNNGLASFILWAEVNGYKKGLQLDREKNDKGYSKDNCRFITQRKNNNNRRVSYVVKKGKYKGRSLADIVHEKNSKIPYSTIANRVKNLGWDVDSALTVPINKSCIRKDLRK